MLKFLDKKDYLIDDEMLGWFLDHGLKLQFISIQTKLQYENSEWLRPYKEFNI